LVTNELVRAMTYRTYGALIASLGAAALIMATTATFAGPAVARGGGLSAPRSMSHPPGQSFRHHGGRNRLDGFWPGDGFYDQPSYGEPLAAVTPPSGDIHTTYTYDVPWDWAHRYPPAVVPSDHPYVTSCPAESVTVPGRNGAEQTINVMRCY
jgi:hypothetical protein